MFPTALQLHRAGHLAQAETMYRNILQQDPKHVETLLMLGMVAFQTQRPEQAVELIRQAVVLQPRNPEAHYNLGVALGTTGELAESIAAFRQVIALQPAHFGAQYNLGVALKKQGDLEGAIAAFQKTVAMNPNVPEAYSNLGNALVEKGQLGEAVAACRKALTLRPNFPEAHNNLGNALKGQGLLEEAIVAFRQAITLRPNFAEAFSNLGVVFLSRDQLDDAIAAQRQAIALNPKLAGAHTSLGNALREKGLVDDAIAAHRQAIAIQPNYAEAHNNLAIALKEQGQMTEAIAAYRQAVTLNPALRGAHDNLVFAMYCDPDFDDREIAEELRRWNRQHGEPLKAFITPHANDRDAERRLRIGYVSPDFREHAVSRFLLPLLTHHNRRDMEIFAYAQVPDPDAMTRRLRECTDAWRNIVGLSDEKAANLIRQDGIDILVDLTLHSGDNRLLIFARKPAPVQVTWLGYAGSTGLTTVDYRLSDRYLDPPDGDVSVYSEQTLRLPDSYWCYQPAPDLPECGPAPALARKSVTFGCLNNFSKMSEPLLRIWAKLLRATVKSRLLLHAREGSHRGRVHALMEHERVDPARVQFTGWMPVMEYFRLYQEIDIALDTFPYGGGTTTCDALWMGVPTVSLVGRTAVGRGGLSLLSNVGLPELAARSEADYVRIAAELAADLPRLSALRANLREQMRQSPLTDGPRFARNIEAAYRQIWRTWCAQPT